MQRRFKLQLFLLVFLVAFAAIGWFIYNSLTFRITGTNPSTSSVATITPFFNINFNKKLDSKKITLSSSPDIISSYSVKGNSLDILLTTPMSSSQVYTINLGQIYSAGGKKILGKSFRFQPTYMTESQLPKDQQQAILSSQQEYNNVIKNNGLLKFLPFVGGGLSFKVDYRITYEVNQPYITITITSPSTTGRQEALAWIRSLGYNPSKYNIQYTLAKISQ